MSSKQVLHGPCVIAMIGDRGSGLGDQTTSELGIDLPKSKENLVQGKSHIA